MSKKSKITIKPFRHQVQMDPNYAENTWKLLKNAIHEIHKQNASGLSFEELYRNAYNMVLHKYGDLLYRGLRQVVHEHLQVVAQRVASAVDDDFLIDLDKAWNEHKMSMLMIRDILMYMDRVYVMHNNVPTVYDLGLMLFLDNVARAPGIKDRLLKIMLTEIKKERQGEVIKTSLLKNITSMLVDLGVNSRQVYEEDFERHFLQTSARFYRIESQQFIATCSCPDYLRKVEIRLKEEETRVSHYLDRSTEHKIREVVEKELIEAHMNTLIEMDGSGLISLLRSKDKQADLARMYRLFSRVRDGHNLMRDHIAKHVRDVGKSIVQNQDSNPQFYIQQIIDLRDKYNELLDFAFFKDKDFTKALNQSFEYFINLNRRSPEYISLFLDEKLRRGLRGLSEDQMEVILRKVMDIFRFVQEKDVFEKYYKQHLAKRLLLGRSISHDAEKGMIQNLKCECGYQFTSKLEGMFNDMRTSADTMDGFKQFLRAGKGASLKGIDLNVQVLTTGFWPTQSSGECTLPPEVLNCCEVFKQYYLSIHTGRRLTWQTNMGTADIRAVFERRKHELSVSTYQMVILLLFRGVLTRKFYEIRKLTGIPINDLKRNLLLLCCGKVRLLLKEPRTKKFDDSDTFTFNMKYRSKLYRVKIMNTSHLSRNNQQTHSVTQQKIEEDRKHQIEAAVVRIMKARKTMNHANLIAATTRQLQSRFRPNPLVVKKRIESLIEREYLERSKTDRKVYKYLA